jgi:hypothetical protein
LILGCVPAADGVRLVMNMPGRIVRVEHQTVQFGPAEVKYARFMVIDPDDGMKMGGHGIPFDHPAFTRQTLEAGLACFP